MSISPHASDRPRHAGPTQRHTIHVHRLGLDVRLGCSAAERARAQRVELDVRIRFARPLDACHTDDLDDTVCYATLAERCRHLAASREFHLLEHLGQELYRTLRGRLPEDARLTLSLRKVAPPVEGLLGGVSFILEEEEP